jgi:hypothetical protein
MSDVEDEVPGDAGEDEFAGLPEVRVSDSRFLSISPALRRCMQLAAPAAGLLQHNSTIGLSQPFQQLDWLCSNPLYACQ